jgi:hypothetical protein
MEGSGGLYFHRVKRRGVVVRYLWHGGDDDDAVWRDKITRRYALTYVDGGNGTPYTGGKNEYDQVIRPVY